MGLNPVEETVVKEGTVHTDTVETSSFAAVAHKGARPADLGDN